MRQQSQKSNSSLKNETDFSKMRQVSQKRENEALEPAPDKDFSSPQTYSDLIKTNNNTPDSFQMGRDRNTAQKPKK